MLDQNVAVILRQLGAAVGREPENAVVTLHIHANLWNVDGGNLEETQ
jgi:hypothetical protein